MTLDLDDLAVPDQLRPFAQMHLTAEDPLVRMAEMLQIPKLTGGVETSALIRFALRLRETAPANPMVWALTNTALGGEIPAWHWAMVNDHPRNQSFRTAIDANVGPGMTILDIGSGTGLLAMMSARAGADHVYAVEESPHLAEIARRCIAANGYADRITLLEINSNQIEIGVHIPRKCDALTHEIMSTTVLDEGIIPTVAHARENLLAPNAALLPERIWAECRVSQAVQSRKRQAHMIEGFDLSPLNILSPPSISATPSPEEMLSDGFQMPEFDLREVDENTRGRRVADVTICRDGTAAGVTQWLGYAFPDGTQFISDNPDSSWGSYFHAFDQNKDVRVGDTLRIRSDFLPKILSFSRV